VSSEVAPWSQTGGLGDVLGALPDALSAHAPDARVGVITPLYRSTAAKLAAAGVTLDAPIARVVQLGERRLEVKLHALKRPGRAEVWFLDAPALYDRDGIYGPGHHLEFGDNHVRYAALCRAAVDHGPELLDGPLAVIHGHDWQAGLAPAYLRLDPAQAATGSVMTIHNLAYRGVYGVGVAAELDLPASELAPGKLEFWGQLSLLKGGLAHADAVTTVSPTYASEILEPSAGEGLDEFLRHDVGRLVGILNGIDDTSWDPATDPALPARFNAEALDGKAACRRALAAEHKLALGPDTIVLAVVSRLAHQKGIDLVCDLVPELHALDAKLIVLGTGETSLEDRLRWLGGTFSQHVAVSIGFDVAHARRIYAGADVFVMPSRFEPCGIGQLYAMRYGTIPVVHAVGGLKDTVIDPGDDELAAGHGTGFRFEFADVAGLRWALGRAVAMRRERPAGWRTLVQAAMRRDASWTASAREYLQLYRAVARAR